MPILGGFTPNRKIQVGYQGSNLLSSTVVTTKAVATRVLPYRGVPDVDLQWTTPDVDTGSLFDTMAPFRKRPELTYPMEGNLAYNDVPYVASGAIAGGISPSSSGSSRTWAHQASGTGSPLGLFTIEFGDDVDGVGEATNDWYQFVGGIIEELTIEGSESDGPLSVRTGWKMAKANSGSWTDYPLSGTVPTAALTVDSSPVWVYFDDTELFINDTSGAIGTTKITDALAAFSLNIRNTFDLKSPANGSNTRNTIQMYGRGRVEGTFEATYHKTTQSVGLLSQSDKVGLNTPDSQFVELRITSPDAASAGIPYSLVIRFPMFDVKREEDARDNNTVVKIRGKIFHDGAGLGYPIRLVAVNTLSAL